jgi:hypothetical protein
MHRFVALFWVMGIVHTIGAGSDATLRLLDRWRNAPVGARVPDRA